MDKLQFYRGYDSDINGLVIHSPTLGEICDYGEGKFYYCAQLICSIPSDYMDELDDMGVRYEDLDEYTFFITTLFRSLQDMDVSILFPNIDIKQLQLAEDTTTHELVRADLKTNFQFNKAMYLHVTKFIRDLCGFKYAPMVAYNDLTRRKMIEASKQRKFMMRNKPQESILLPLISSLVNCSEFKYGHKDVWDMPFYAFMDSVKRVQAVRTADEMLTGGYFGIKLSDNKVKEHLNWMRPL